jgi:hypothetical protein
MTWRKILVRGLVLSALGGLLLAGGLFALWTNPAAIRQLVQDQLAGRFVAVTARLDYARLRLLGGILVRELRMARSDGLDPTDFLYAPTCVIYHDKEHLLDGKVLVRQVELYRPQFRLVRDHDGRFNLAGILGPLHPDERLPTLVVHDGVLVFEDHALSPAGPLLEVRHVELTLLNDPLSTLQLEGSGEIDLFGPVRLRAAVPRGSMAADVQIDLPAVPLGPDVQRRVGLVFPPAAGFLEQLTGRAEFHARLRLPGNGPGPPSYDVRARLRDARCAHPALPAVVEHIDFQGRVADGVVSQAALSARSGEATLRARVADFRLPNDPAELSDPHRLVRELDFDVLHVRATPDVLQRLPPFLAFIQHDFSPTGPVSVHYAYRREGPGPHKLWRIDLEGVEGAYRRFKYPLRGVRGGIRVDASAQPVGITLDLTAETEGPPVTLHGVLKGGRKSDELHIEIRGQDVLLDDRILAALPPDAQKTAQHFLSEPSRRRGLRERPMGRADFVAAIDRAAGSEDLQKNFTITFKDAAVEYDQLPIPWEHVSGVLRLHPDRWECVDFRGSHAGGEVRVSGASTPLARPAGGGGLPGLGTPAVVRLRIQGKQVALDGEFERALAPAGGDGRKPLQEAWRTLGLGGRMTFDATVIDHPDRPRDIDVSVTARGCTMKPRFFLYRLDEVSGSVRYAAGRVALQDVRARHGGGQLSVARGLVELRPEGGYTAWLQGLSGRHITPDRDLLAALPEGVRRGLQPLRLSKPVDVATALTLKADGAAGPVRVWWDGGLALTDATLHAGVDVTGANGQFFCQGHHDGHQLRGMTGDLSLKSARVLGQPVTDVHGRLEVLPETPEVVRVRDLQAGLFGGTVGAEARLEIGPTPRYDVLVEALGVQLGAFGKHNLGPAAKQAQLQGPARASVSLQGQGGDLTGLKGNGRLDVTQGKMGQLPVLLDLLKAFGLRVPDRTAFEEAHMVFAVEGPQLRVQQLDLYGNAISLRGQGTVDLDGNNLNLDFTATPGRFSQVLPSGIDAIPQMISQQFLKIKMRGKLGQGGNIRFDKELVPGVVEPLRRAIGGE